MARSGNLVLPRGCSTMGYKVGLYKFEGFGRFGRFMAVSKGRDTARKKGTRPWLGVGAASTLLAVSPSTLRRWTDKELVPARTTAGGHRRYSREVIENLSEEHGPRAMATTAPGTMAAHSVEWNIPHERLQAQQWYGRFASSQGISSMRAQGQRLLGLLIQHISRRKEDPRFLVEATEVGRTQGRLSAEHGVTLREVIEAFLFFRNSLSNLALQAPGTADASDGQEIVRLAQVADRFMNAVLLGIAEGYESAGSSPRGPDHTEDVNVT